MANATEKKIVLLPIIVPKGNFCWDGLNHCAQFDCTGGYGNCNLSIGIPVKTTKGTYDKPEECEALAPL